MDTAALQKACYKGDVAAAKLCLAAGVVVTFECVQRAVSSGSKGEAKRKRGVCELLFAVGADPNMLPTPGHATVLEVVASRVCHELLQMVIAAGARLDQGCPVHTAVGWNRPENVRVLLDAGADPDIGLTAVRLKEDDPIAGMTALEYARHLRYKQCEHVLLNG